MQGKLHIPHQCPLPLLGFTILIHFIYENLSEGPQVGSCMWPDNSTTQRTWLRRLLSITITKWFRCIPLLLDCSKVFDNIINDKLLLSCMTSKVKLYLQVCLHFVYMIELQNWKIMVMGAGLTRTFLVL